jgi:hypothetical protein
MAFHDWLFVRGGEWLRRHDGVRLTLKYDGWCVHDSSGARVQSLGPFNDVELARVACDNETLR